MFSVLYMECEKKKQPCAGILLASYRSSQGGCSYSALVSKEHVKSYIFSIKKKEKVLR